MKRKTRRARLKANLEKAVKAYVKERDNYTCQWCGKEVQGTNCHWSHIIGRRIDGRLVYDPMNSLVHCYNCHINKWHKDPIAAAAWFEDMFPGRYAYLQEQRIKNEKLGSIKEAWFLEQIDLY